MYKRQSPEFMGQLGYAGSGSGGGGGSPGVSSMTEDEINAIQMCIRDRWYEDTYRKINPERYPPLPPLPIVLKHSKLSVRRCV